MARLYRRLGMGRAEPCSAAFQPPNCARKLGMEDRGDLLLPPPHGGDVVLLLATPGAQAPWRRLAEHGSALPPVGHG